MTATTGTIVFVVVVVVVVVIFSSSTTFIAVHITVRVLMKGEGFSFCVFSLLPHFQTPNGA